MSRGVIVSTSTYDQLFVFQVLIFTFRLDIFFKLSLLEKLFSDL